MSLSLGHYNVLICRHKSCSSSQKKRKEINVGFLSPVFFCPFFIVSNSWLLTKYRTAIGNMISIDKNGIMMQKIFIIFSIFSLFFVVVIVSWCLVLFLDVFSISTFSLLHSFTFPFFGILNKPINANTQYSFCWKS
jgi:hypothetical protein